MNENNEKELFNAGCFLPSWTEDIQEEQSPISQVFSVNQKDLSTLVSELAEIKNHIDDVRQRKWDIEKELHFHENKFAKE